MEMLEAWRNDGREEGGGQNVWRSHIHSWEGMSMPEFREASERGRGGIFLEGAVNELEEFVRMLDISLKGNDEKPFPYLDWPTAWSLYDILGHDILGWRYVHTLQSEGCVPIVEEDVAQVVNNGLRGIGVEFEHFQRPPVALESGGDVASAVSVALTGSLLLRPMLQGWTENVTGTHEFLQMVAQCLEAPIVLIGGDNPWTFLPYLEERGLEEEMEILNNSILLYEWSPDRIFPIVPTEHFGCTHWLPWERTPPVFRGHRHIHLGISFNGTVNWEEDVIPLLKAIQMSLKGEPEILRENRRQRAEEYNRRRHARIMRLHSEYIR